MDTQRRIPHPPRALVAALVAGTVIAAFVALAVAWSERINVLTPRPGLWRTAERLPDKRLDAGGASLNGKLYVVAGKNTKSHLRTATSYDPAARRWVRLPSIPGKGVENPAVVGFDGKLYVFGGGTQAFSGAVAAAASYDPGTRRWTTLRPMNARRSGAAAVAVGGRIYVIGGMDERGASLATVSVFDPGTDTWKDGPLLGVRRDNPGAAVLKGRVFVFGGRTRDADGTTADGTLATVEMLNPSGSAPAWTPRASMPTGRRAMAVGLVNGRAQLVGGEATASDTAFSANEEYDPDRDAWRKLAPPPTPRHGAATGTIDGRVYVVSGGRTSGLSVSDVNEAFRLDN